MVIIVAGRLHFVHALPFMLFVLSRADGVCCGLLELSFAVDLMCACGWCCLLLLYSDVVFFRMVTRRSLRLFDVGVLLVLLLVRVVCCRLLIMVVVVCR